jgi:hypothetical protein
VDGFSFDALTRTLMTAGSRRRALTGVVSGTLGLVLGASVIDEAEAAKKCPPCKKRKKGKCKKKLPDGTACRGGSCQSGRCVVSACVPEPQLATCHGRCGTWINNCGQIVPCFTCTDGKQCLSNGSCAALCDFDLQNCPAGCFCGLPSTEVSSRCISGAAATCEEIPQSCTSSAQCPQGQHCQDVPCGPGGMVVHRCVPLCTA